MSLKKKNEVEKPEEKDQVDDRVVRDEQTAGYHYANDSTFHTLTNAIWDQIDKLNPLYKTNLYILYSVIRNYEHTLDLIMLL